MSDTSKIPAKKAKKILALVEGDPNAHHMKLKKAYKEVMGDDPEDLQAVRDRLESVQSNKRGGTAKTTEEWVKSLSEKNPCRWARVVSVAETNDKNKPVRVIVRCEVDGCEETREIATQDLFQVRFCPEHLREHKLEVARIRRVQSRATKPPKAKKAKDKAAA